MHICMYVDIYIYKYFTRGRVYIRNVVNIISLYYVLCLVLLCFVVDLFIASTTHPTKIYIYICMLIIYGIIHYELLERNQTRNSMFNRWNDSRRLFERKDLIGSMEFFCCTSTSALISPIRKPLKLVAGKCCHIRPTLQFGRQWSCISFDRFQMPCTEFCLILMQN